VLDAKMCASFFLCVWLFSSVTVVPKSPAQSNSFVPGWDWVAPPRRCMPLAGCKDMIYVFAIFTRVLDVKVWDHVVIFFLGPLVNFHLPLE
jgi:hypothetical protein